MRRIEVGISGQVVEFVMRQAPDARKRLRRALRGLELESGDIRALEGRLESYHRLRVGAFRIIFRYLHTHGRRSIRCEYAERRSMVYEAFEAVIAQLR